MNKRDLTAAFLALASMTFTTYGQSQSGQQSTSGQSRQDSNRTGSKNDSSKQSGQSGQSSQTNLDSSDRRFVMEAAENGVSEVMMGQMAVQRASSDQVKKFAQHMVDDHTKANQELMELASSKGITLPQSGIMSGDRQMNSHNDHSSADTQNTRSSGQSGQTSSQQSRTVTGQQTQGSSQSSERANQSSGQTGQNNQDNTSHNAKDKATMERISRLSGAEFDREYMRQQVKDHDKAVELFQKEADKGKDQELKAWASKTLPTLREHQQMTRQIASTVEASNKSGSSNKSGGSSKSGNSSENKSGQSGRP